MKLPLNPNATILTGQPSGVEPVFSLSWTKGMKTSRAQRLIPKLSKAEREVLLTLLRSGPQVVTLGFEKEAETCFRLGLVKRKPIRLAKSTDRYTAYEYDLTPEGRNVAKQSA